MIDEPMLRGRLDRVRKKLKLYKKSKMTIYAQFDYGYLRGQQDLLEKDLMKYVNK